MYFLGVLGRWILTEMCQRHSSTNNPYPFYLIQLSFVLPYHPLHCGSFCISVELRGRQLLPWDRRFWAQDQLNSGLGLSMMQPPSGASLLPAVTFVQKGSCKHLPFKVSELPNSWVWKSSSPRPRSEQGELQQELVHPACESVQGVPPLPVSDHPHSMKDLS